MANQPESATNPNPSLEERMNVLEGNMSQILGLLKTLTSNKDTIGSNGNGGKPLQNQPDLSASHHNNVAGGSPAIEVQTKDIDDVVVVTPKGYHTEGMTALDAQNREADARMLSKMELLEEKMRAMQGLEGYGRLDMQDFCLFPDIEIPAKFKVPDFEKFEGKTDPMIHLTMYTRSMAAYHKNEELMIHCFQHSLAGGALTWFLHLDKSQVKSWRNLAELFVKQYQFVTDIAPDRFELQRMRKTERETFREYAQRWREKASQVQPPLNEKEIVRLFVKTLDGAYFEKLLGCVTNRFADVVVVGEQIEDAIKEGKLSGYQDKFKKPNFQKKEGDVHTMSLENNPIYQHFPYHVSPSYPPNYITNQPDKPRRERINIEPIPMTYGELYKTLLEKRLVGPKAPKPVPNPLPKWHNPNETCEYHMGAPGHSIEKCLTFKLRVQKMRNANKLIFDIEKEQSAGPSIEKNPLVKYRT